MRHQTKPVEFQEFATRLDTIFDEIEANGGSVTVERGGQQFTVSPKVTRPKGGKSSHFSPTDPLFNIIGIGHSEGPTDVSSNKHKYIADAIASHSDASGSSGAVASDMPIEGTTIAAAVEQDVE